MAQGEERTLADTRAPRKADAIAARVAAEVSRLKPAANLEGVQPLNPGFFKLEEIRANTVAKARAVVRPAVKGK